MNEQTKWTEADFDDMTWHDCQVNAIALDQEGEWQSDLVLELDFIVEWLCGADKRYRLRVAPAVLRFTNVNNLRLDISLKFKQPLVRQAGARNLRGESPRRGGYSSPLRIECWASGGAERRTMEVKHTQKQNALRSDVCAIIPRERLPNFYD